MNTKRTSLAFLMALVALLAPSFAAADPKPSSDGRAVLDLSGPGWTMWFDETAPWKNDELFLPPVDLSKVPTNAPTCGWDGLDKQKVVQVAVPGTVEGYLPPPKSGHGYLGVSWWWRTVKIPENIAGRRVVLKFDAVRQRGEIYLDNRLVGYDLIGNTPFEVDITPWVKPGQECRLAVRVTNPGGSYTCDDTKQIPWGKYLLPTSHGFGGITGDVKLEVIDPVHVGDVYVQNTPAITTAKIQVTLRNVTDKPEKRDVRVLVMEKKNHGAELWSTTLNGVEIPPGETTVPVEVSAPKAKVWDLDHPELYTCRVELSKNGGHAGDSVERTFGFRWFSPEGVGSAATLRLNGKRIFVRTAISWGYWPINGIFPTPELAEKQIRTAKDFGMNMLNFHRTIGQPLVLDKADEMGLLYFEEPGGYVTGGNSAFGQAMAREKLLRMVKRDRSHPSLVIYNMINEQWDKYGADKDEALYAVHSGDLRLAHEADPSRIAVYTSAWVKKVDADEKSKLHMRPYDTNQYFHGWYDDHRAGGPVTWQEAFYKNPTNHYGYLNNPREIVYWGEEGAISTPSPLGTIKTALDAAPFKGFDGSTWIKWHDRIGEFLKQKGLTGQFPSVDAFCTNLASASLEHQGRKFELTRICDDNDGYCINGWEETIDDNHSAVVDCWRNPKADTNLIAHYNQPLYVAVLSRNLVAESTAKFIVDFFALNEVDLKGAHTLRITAKDATGAKTFTKDVPVTLAGGDVFGQSLAEGVEIPAGGKPGIHLIEAALVDASGKSRATGGEQVLSVDWKSEPLPGNGAVFEWGHNVTDFLKSRGVNAPAFDGSQGKLDWLIVARPPYQAPTVIPPEYFVDGEGKPAGVKVSFFKGDLRDGPSESTRTDPTIDFSCSAGAAPDPGLGADRNYSVRWEGTLLPPITGHYALVLNAYRPAPARLVINDQQVIYMTGDDKQREVQLDLEKGKPVRLRLEYTNRREGGMARLEWAMPDPKQINPEQILTRARNDGTAVLIMDYAYAWIPLLKAQHLVEGDQERMNIGYTWNGGQYFARPHPLLKDLPADGVMTWPYEAVLQLGRGRYGLKLQGEELVVGCWQSTPFDLGTAVGIVPCGKGKIVLSTLDICPNLSKPGGPADVARKLLCNFLQFVSAK
jgi:beta-galactosidase